ncbi:peptidase inhibitor family I36 protein [Dactylosporangium salmoneum]|uniref:Peptidase inhibitor family I36 n=1 Tax=Dactylosporangium salmoneum TaxID=53361 RepID=A0ABN3HNB8_9ACTN
MWRVCAGLMAALALAGTAAGAPVAADVAAYLAAHPGGHPLGGTGIAYGGGVFVVTLRAPAQQNAVVDCPAGWFCFYDRPDYGYPRGKLSSCGWQSLAYWGWQDRVESAYYNIGKGGVQFWDGSTYLFAISADARARGDASPYRNRATDVYRYC